MLGSGFGVLSGRKCPGAGTWQPRLHSQSCEVGPLVRSLAINTADSLPEEEIREITSEELEALRKSLGHAQWVMRRKDLPHVSPDNAEALRTHIRHLSDFVSEPLPEGDEACQLILATLLTDWEQEELDCLAKMLCEQDFHVITFLITFEDDEPQIAL